MVLVTAIIAAWSIVAPLFARLAPPVIRPSFGPGGPLAIRFPPTGGVPPAAIIAPACVATRRASGPLAATGPAPAVIGPSPSSKIVSAAAAGALIVVASLVVRVRILGGRLLEPVRH
jgi:hypothetical protein